VALSWLLLAGLGGAAWAWAHRGYPAVVYYRRVAFGGPAQTLVMEEWVDPQRRLIRRRQAWLGSAGDLVIRHGRVYSLGVSAPDQGTPVSPAVQRGLGYLFQGLAAGGFAGLGRELLLHRVGPATRLRAGGRALLCFGADGFDVDALSALVCIDARTSIPVSERFTLNQGTVLDAVYSHDTRFPAYTLPSGLFDLAQPQRSPWEWLLAWLQDHLRPADAACRELSCAGRQRHPPGARRRGTTLHMHGGSYHSLSYNGRTSRPGQLPLTFVA
jgi:hypothetical protein